MQTIDFLREILPAQGWYYASRLLKTTDSKGKSVKKWINDPHDNLDDLAASVRHYDAQGVDTYFALAGFNQASYQKTTPRGRTLTKTRTQENAGFLKAFWLDIDCGPGKPYPTQKEALQDLSQHLKGNVHNPPRPSYIVNSGYGLHLYWVLDRTIEATEWQRVATVFKQVIVHLGLRVDAPVIADSARVLRPVGTHNYKDAQNPRPVSVIPTKQARHYSVRDFALAIFRMAKAAGLDQTAQKRTPKSGLHTLAGRLAHRDFQPFSARIMADNCPAFKEMRDTRGKHQEYPYWFSCLQTLVHAAETTDDDTDLIHEWSSAYPDYDERYVEEKIQDIKDAELRPVRCETMALSASGCTSCEHRGRINSPVRLGYQTPGHQTEAPVQAEPEVPGMRTKQFEVPPLPPVFAGRFRWDGAALQGTRIKYDAEGNEVKRWEVPITPFFFIVDFLYRESENDPVYLRVNVRIRHGEWQTTDVPIAALARGGSVAMAALAEYLGVVVAKNVEPLLEDYVRTWTEYIRHTSDLEHVRRTLGWQTDGSFVLGQRAYCPDGEIQTAVINRSLQRHIEALTPRGDLTRYKALIDYLYNRPDRTAHQIVWMSGFASVLSAIYDAKPVGLVISATSEKSGSGKSSAAYAATAVWGDPYDTKAAISASATTEYAVYRLAGERKHLPVMMDEITLWDAERLADFLYLYSQGTPKNRGKSDGGLADVSHLSWSNMLLLTANAKVSSKVVARQGNSAPMLARILEVPFPEEDLRKTDKVGVEMSNELLREHTGIAGDAFLRTLVAIDKTQLREHLERMFSKINEDLGLESADRFWAQAATHLLIAFSLTKRIGLHSFDTGQFKQAVYRCVEQMQAIVDDSTDDLEDTLGAMMADLNAGIIATDAPGRLNHRNDNILLKPLPRGRVQGRIITQGDKAGVYLLAKDVRRWCNDNQRDYNALRDTLMRQGILLEPGARFNLGLGTPLSTGRPRSWRLRYDALQQTTDTVLQLATQDGEKVNAFAGDDDDDHFPTTEPAPVEAPDTV